MKRVLLVDDDPVLLRIYQHALTHLGLQVETAPDGLAALRALHISKPDVMVLDLMMPRLSGTDVLKTMRSQPELADVPVIVLSNAYMDALARDAAAAGAQAGLLKTRCTPSILAQMIQQVLEGEEPTGDDSRLLAVPEPRLERPAAPATPPPQATLRKLYGTSPPQAAELEWRAEARQKFLDTAEEKRAAIWSAFMAFNQVAAGAERNMRLDDLYRSVRLLSAAAGLAGCHRLAQMATALEALLYQMVEDQMRITPSSLSTCAMAVDLFQGLFREAKRGQFGKLAIGKVLVVDNDPVSNQTVVSSLNRINLHARSTQDPTLALQWIEREKFDVILLDIELRGMTGFDLCKRIRAMPRYAKTPVIYVTVHSDFENLARSVISGANDLIAKPILPMELAVKTVMHLLKSQTPD